MKVLMLDSMSNEDNPGNCIFNQHAAGSISELVDLCPEQFSTPEVVNMTGCMLDPIRHRFPDDEGSELIGLSTIKSSDQIAKHLVPEVPNAVIFGHRCLSIIDPTRNSHQSMYDRTCRYVIVFKEEIYNYLELRSVIGYCWHQKSNWGAFE